MKICLLRYCDENGQTVYHPESITAIDAVGLAAKLDQPEIVTVELAGADLVRAASEVRIVRL